MNPKKGSTTAGNESHLSPFDQISQLENEQEQRVAAANEKAMLEEKELEKATNTLEKEQEETLKKSASEELKKYSQSEPATILQESEKAATDEVKAMKSDMSKQLSKKADALVADFLKNPSAVLSA